MFRFFGGLRGTLCGRFFGGFGHGGRECTVARQVVGHPADPPVGPVTHHGGQRQVDGRVGDDAAVVEPLALGHAVRARHRHAARHTAAGHVDLAHALEVDASGRGLRAVDRRPRVAGPCVEDELLGRRGGHAAHEDRHPAMHGRHFVEDDGHDARVAHRHELRRGALHALDQFAAPDVALRFGLGAHAGEVVLRDADLPARHGTRTVVDGPQQGFVGGIAGAVVEAQVDDDILAGAAAGRCRLDPRAQLLPLVERHDADQVGFAVDLRRRILRGEFRRGVGRLRTLVLRHRRERRAEVAVAEPAEQLACGVVTGASVRGDLLCQARLEQLVFGAVPGLHLRGEAGIVRLHLPQGEVEVGQVVIRGELRPHGRQRDDAERRQKQGQQSLHGPYFFSFFRMSGSPDGGPHRADRCGITPRAPAAGCAPPRRGRCPLRGPSRR